MPQPEKPERLMPDIKSELMELADAQDVKVETQKSKFAELEHAKLMLKKEAEDVLRIAYENSPDPEKFILEAIEDYAKSEKISLLAAKARVLQYLSPEWKKKVDAEVKEYFAEFDLTEFVRLPVGSKESTEAIKTLQILCDEGYMPYFVIAVHHCCDPEAKKQALTKFEEFAKTAKEMFDEAEKKDFEEKENFVLDSKNIFPEARKYLERMKKTKTKKEYEYMINLAYKYLILGRATGGKFPEFDCDESTLFLQKMATDESLEIGDYMVTFEHVVLKLDGLPLVLDTFDMRIRMVEECARKEGYGEDFHESYFWRDSTEEYLAQYENSDHYPRKITGYKRVKKPYLVESGRSMGALLTGSAVLLKSLGDISSAKLYCEKALEINSNYAEAHYNLAVLLKSSGDVPGAKLYCEKALKINPNYAEAHYGLAILLKSSGDISGAKLHCEKALKINPNYVEAHYNLAVLLSLSGDVSGAKLHYEKVLEINPNSAEAHNNLAILLKSSGDVLSARLHYEKALKINPNYVEVHNNLAILLYEQNKMQEARVHLNEFDKLRGGRLEHHYRWLDKKLKEKGF